MSVNTAYGGDFIKEVTTSTTTGSIFLPDVASTGFVRWSDWFTTGNRVTYAINDKAGHWEVGIGTINNTTHTITRDYTFWSSNAGATVDFTGIQADVYCSPSSMSSGILSQLHANQRSSNPGAGNDTSSGFDAGSFWVNNPEFTAFICFDPTASAAVWGQLLTSLTKIIQPSTMTAGGTTGAQTINNPSGSVNFAASATSLVVTNSLVSASSIIQATVQTHDSTMTSVQAVPASGSFTLYANAAATAETKVAFLVVN